MKVKPTCHCSVLAPEPQGSNCDREACLIPFLSHPGSLLWLSCHTYDLPSASTSQVYDGIAGVGCHAWLTLFCTILAFPDMLIAPKRCPWTPHDWPVSVPTFLLVASMKMLQGLFHIICLKLTPSCSDITPLASSLSLSCLILTSST